ncbi:RNA-binding protein 44 isoform X1 [Hemicordylus capensis]|uniref:RNA-binding protein 44 isoform X1 n=1 Tax=Hemicordylus capensis TaxID=884348 RepID=UPI0023022031|nr:RNA-binding protein 44 isoform X1 [Hemicordylus capensis]
MSCLPYFNENVYARPLLCARPWFQGHYLFHEGFAYSVVPLYICPRTPLCTPETYCPVTIDPSHPFVVAPFSPVASNYWQREYYCRYGTAAINASGRNVLTKPSTNSPSGENAIIKSSQPSSSSEKSRFDEVMLKLIASSDCHNASTMQQTQSGVEKVACKSEILNAFQESEHTEQIKITNISSELQVGTSCSISSQSCYLSASELTLPKENLSYLSSSFDDDLDVACKERQRISIAVHNANEADIDNLGKGCISIYSRDNQNDEYRFSDLDDDSQLEYHSAEEQDYVDQSSSSRQETESSESLQSKELGNEDESIDDQQSVNKLEDKSSTSVCSVDDCYDYSEISKFPQMYENGQCSEDTHLNFEDGEREQTISIFYSFLNEDSGSAKAAGSKGRNNSKSLSVSNITIDEKMEATDTALVSEMASDGELCKKTDHTSTSVLQKSGNSHILQQGRTFLPHAHIYSGDSAHSDSCVYQESIVSAIRTDKENCSHRSHGHSGRCQENLPNSELKCITYLNDGPSKVNQAVDASSDFRACFTTSRATNIKASVVSRAQNTVITMMNKGRPKEWLDVSHRSVACNTDWSCICGDMEMTSSQIAMADILENCITCETAKHGWKSNMEDHLELNSRDLNEILSRMMQLSQEITNHLPNCCKELLQRVITAEMQFLRIRCQMYHRHCQQTCRPVIEEKEYVSNSTFGTVKSVLQVSLPQDMEASSAPLVTRHVSVDENSAPQLFSNERDQLVENGSLNTQEISEDWFDAKENLTVTDSSVSVTGNEIEKHQLKLTGTTEMQTKEESKNFYYVHVGGLSPSVSEVDLWLRFQKYNISETSIGFSNNYRFATLGFKAATDAVLAVKEMNGREIKGKAVKVQLVETVRESGVPDYWRSVKQDHKTQRPCYSSEKPTEYKKNHNVTLKAPVSVSTTSALGAGAPVSTLKGPDVTKGSIKSSLSPLASASVPQPASASLRQPHCSLAPSKVSNPGLESSKTSSKNALLQIDQEEIAEGLLPLDSIQFTPNPSTIYIPPNSLNLRSFRKVVKKLEELHPETSRNSILDALVEMKETKGLLSGLSLSTIVQITSSLLKKKYTPKPDKNP